MSEGGGDTKYINIKVRTGLQAQSLSKALQTIILLIARPLSGCLKSVID